MLFSESNLQQYKLHHSAETKGSVERCSLTVESNAAHPNRTRTGPHAYVIGLISTRRTFRHVPYVVADQINRRLTYCNDGVAGWSTSSSQ